MTRWWGTLFCESFFATIFSKFLEYLYLINFLNLISSFLTSDSVLKKPKYAKLNGFLDACFKSV